MCVCVCPCVCMCVCVSVCVRERERDGVSECEYEKGDWRVKPTNDVTPPVKIQFGARNLLINSIHHHKDATWDRFNEYIIKFAFNDKDH